MAPLTDPLRWQLYGHVVDQGRPVSRDEAAASAGISRKLAAHHLDRLVRAGLLSVTFGRPAGRRGPGAGRPSKLYERSPTRIEVSIPERRYDLIGSITVRAAKTAPSGGSVRDALLHAAGEIGREHGTAARQARRLR